MKRSTINYLYFLLGSAITTLLLVTRFYYFYKIERYQEIRLNPAEIVRCELLVAPNEEVSQILFNSFMRALSDPPPPPPPADLESQ